MEIIVKNYFISRYHPVSLFVWFLGMTLVAVFGVSPFYTLLFALGGIFLSLGLGLKKIRSDVGFYLLLVVFSAVINPVFSHNGATPLFFLNGNAYTLEAVLYGACFGFLICAVLIWFKVFGAVFDSEKIMSLFGNIFPSLALLFSVVLRYVPTVLAKYRTINAAHRAMGLHSQTGIVNDVKAHLSVFSALVTVSMEDSAETGISMRSRGFGLGRRTSFEKISFKKRDALILFSALLLTGLSLLGTEGLNVDFYPKIALTQPPPLAYLGLGAFGILTALPFCAEMGAYLKWRYSLSKM